jgi:hypothetical protein
MNNEDTRPGDGMRAKAHELFDAQTRDGPQARPLRASDVVVGTIPSGPGFEITIVRAAGKGRSLGVLFFQAFRIGPGDRRVAASGALMLPIESLAPFAAVVAEVVDEELRVERAWPRPARNGPAAHAGEHTDHTTTNGTGAR